MWKLFLLKVVTTWVAILGGVRGEEFQGLNVNLKSFSWSTCGPNSPIIIENLLINPDPIVVPGTVSATFKVTSMVDVGSPTKASVRLEKKLGSNFYTVPCLNGMGSCQYDDVCSLLERFFPQNQGCPEALLQNNIPCNCAFLAGTYGVDNANFDVPVTFPAVVINGDYRLKTTLSRGDNEELACYDFWFTLKAAQN